MNVSAQNAPYPPPRRPAAQPQRGPVPARSPQPAREPVPRPPERVPIRKPARKVMGEHVLLEIGSARKSMKHILRYIVSLALIIFGIYSMFTGMFNFIPMLPGFYISMVFLGIGIIVLIISELRMMSSSYMITATRVIENVGILRKRTNAVQISMITGTHVKQGIFDRVLGVGTLVINTHQKTGALTLDDINDPAKVESLILQHNRGHIPAPAPAAPPQAPPAYPPQQPYR